jgi:hypothetical protein
MKTLAIFYSYRLPTKEAARIPGKLREGRVGVLKRNGPQRSSAAGLNDP